VAQYLGRVDVGGVDARATVQTVRVAPGLAMVDGANGVGPLVGMRALEAAMPSAREVGIGAALARASNHLRQLERQQSEPRPHGQGGGLVSAGCARQSLASIDVIGRDLTQNGGIPTAALSGGACR
jgi:hypothetical protein